MINFVGDDELSSKVEKGTATNFNNAS